MRAQSGPGEVVCLPVRPYSAAATIHIGEVVEVLVPASASLFVEFRRLIQVPRQRFAKKSLSPLISTAFLLFVVPVEEVGWVADGELYLRTMRGAV